MDKYIVGITLCDKKEIADKIIENLLEKRLVVGCQVSKVFSKYWWKNELEECNEYKLEFRTKERLFDKVESEIKKLHDYEIAEISSYEIKNANKDFLDWIDENLC